MNIAVSPTAARRGASPASHVDAAIDPGTPPLAMQTVAEVTGGTADRPEVAFGDTRQPARTALSCLLCPEIGDRVLVARAGAALWVLAVLERSGEGKLRVAVQGDLEVASVHGRLSLSGGQRLDLATPGPATLRAGELTLRARVARALIDDLHHAGERLVAHVGRIKLAGVALETVIERVMTRAKRSYRFVEETDQLRSADIDHRAADTLRLSGGNAFVLADEVVKMDGTQIHMG